MKNVLLYIAIVLGGICYSQQKNNLFKENPPSLPPAIFQASMPPCLIGVAYQYGNEIGVTDDTMKKANDFIKEAHKEVPNFKKRVKELELQLMKASKEERYEDYEKLLHKLSEVKIEASLFHEGLVKRAREGFNPKDVKKLDDFIITNQDVFLESVKLN